MRADLKAGDKPAVTADARAIAREWAEPGVYPVAPGVHRVPLPLPTDGLRAVNVYVIEADDGLVLIDSGWALDAARKALDLGPGQPSAPGSGTSARSWSPTCTGTTTRWGSSCAGSSAARCPSASASGRPSRRCPAARPSRSRRSWPSCGPAGRRRSSASSAISPGRCPAAPPTGRSRTGGSRRTRRSASATAPWRVLPTPGHTRGHVVFRDAGRRAAVRGRPRAAAHHPVDRVRGGAVPASAAGLPVSRCGWSAACRTCGCCPPTGRWRPAPTPASTNCSPTTTSGSAAAWRRCRPARPPRYEAARALRWTRRAAPARRAGPVQPDARRDRDAGTPGTAGGPGPAGQLRPRRRRCSTRCPARPRGEGARSRAGQPGAQQCGLRLSFGCRLLLQGAARGRESSSLVARAVAGPRRAARRPGRPRRRPGPPRAPPARPGAARAPRRPVTDRPVRHSSSALGRPTMSTSGFVPIRSGTRPSEGSFMQSIASSASTRRSQPSASWKPAPMAWPRTAATEISDGLRSQANPSWQAATQSSKPGIGGARHPVGLVRPLPCQDPQVDAGREGRPRSPYHHHPDVCREGPADLGQSPPHPGGHGVTPIGARQRHRGRARARLSQDRIAGPRGPARPGGTSLSAQRFALALPRVAPPRPRSDTPFSVRIRCTKP